LLRVLEVLFGEGLLFLEGAARRATEEALDVPF